MTTPVTATTLASVAPALKPAKVTKPLGTPAKQTPAYKNAAALAKRVTKR